MSTIHRKFQEESVALLSSSPMPLGMPLMLLPILRIPFSQLPVMNHQKVLRIVPLGTLGKVKRTRDRHLSVNDHDLVMG